MRSGTSLFVQSEGGEESFHVETRGKTRGQPRRIHHALHAQKIAHVEQTERDGKSSLKHQADRDSFSVPEPE